MDNDNYNDNYYEEFTPKRHGRVYKGIRAVFLVIIVLFGVFLGARIHINNTVPSEARVLLWNEEAFAAYTASPESFSVFNHEISSYTDPDTSERVIRNRMTGDAYFSFSNVQYMPSVCQLQLTVRYNESTVRHIMENYALTDEPEGEMFRFFLVDESGQVYEDYSFTAHTQYFLGQRRYHYRRLVFPKVNTEKSGTLTLKIYYIDDVGENREIDEIIVYDDVYERLSEKVEVDYEGPSEPTQNLTSAPLYIVKETENGD